MGMGLYIVKGTVESLGGNISLQSSNKGTCFSVKIPSGSGGETLSLSDFKISSPAITLIDDSSVENFPLDLNRKTVLLVEDNREMILSIREALLGSYNVLCAKNGKEALELLEKNSVTIIVSDIMMDTMDGFEFLEKIRSNPESRNIPFIFLTAKSGILDEIKGLQKGAIDYIPKPFTIDTLKAKIHTLLEYNSLKKRAFELEKYKSVGMLTASICHEIMNPLSGIKGPLYVIEQNAREMGRSDDDTLMKGIHFVRENVNRIEDIVGTMRSLFHGETYSFENIELNSFIKPVLQTLKDRIGESISFELKMPLDLHLKTNRGAFTQILMNFLSNAMESIKGPGKISIEADSKSLLIKDSGCGIPPDHLNKIFDLAFTTKKESGGTGLGLYIVKELADRLSIKVQIDSEVGKGTEVRLGF